MRLYLILLFMLALPLSAQAQASLEGSWMLTFMMEEGASRTMSLNAETVQDTLHLTMPWDDGDLACAADCLTYDESGCSYWDMSCCETHGVPGCDDPVVEACVCALDSYCCNNWWDGDCTLQAINDCGAVC